MLSVWHKKITFGRIIKYNSCFMAHHNSIKESSYKKLAERINRFPQGAVASDLLFEILKILLSEREAGMVSLLPIKPFNARKAAGIWSIKEEEAKKILNDLADRGCLQMGSRMVMYCTQCLLQWLVSLSFRS